MQIHLVRTSLAETDAVPEAHRFLSLEGRRLVREVGNRLRLNEEPSFDRIVTSPMAAAVQTAELFADRVDFIGTVDVLPALGANVPAEVLAPKLLALLGQAESIAIVTDEPLLASLGAFFIGRPTFPPAVHGQVSVIVDRKPAYCMRPGEVGRSLLLVA